MKKFFKKLFWCFHDFNFYKFISLLGSVIRTIILPKLLPNIFEVIAAFFIGHLNVPQWAYEILLRASLFFIDNIGITRIFHHLAFATVGNGYTKTTIYNKNDRIVGGWWGSLFYTIFYTIYWTAPLLLFNYFEWFTIFGVYFAYFAICLAYYKLSEIFNTIPEIKNFYFRFAVQIGIATFALIGLSLLKAYVV